LVKYQVCNFRLQLQ